MLVDMDDFSAGWILSSVPPTLMLLLLADFMLSLERRPPWPPRVLPAPFMLSRRCELDVGHLDDGVANDDFLVELLLFVIVLGFFFFIDAPHRSSKQLAKLSADRWVVHLGTELLQSSVGLILNANICSSEQESLTWRCKFRENYFLIKLWKPPVSTASVMPSLVATCCSRPMC